MNLSRKIEEYINQLTVEDYCHLKYRSFQIDDSVKLKKLTFQSLKMTQDTHYVAYIQKQMKAKEKFDDIEYKLIGGDFFYNCYRV